MLRKKNVAWRRFSICIFTRRTFSRMVTQSCLPTVSTRNHASTTFLSTSTVPFCTYAVAVGRTVWAGRIAEIGS